MLLSEAEYVVEMLSRRCRMRLVGAVARHTRSSARSSAEHALKQEGRMRHRRHYNDNDYDYDGQQSAL